MPTTYIAESLAADAMAGHTPPRPRTDEDVAMGAPVLVEHGPDPVPVRHALALHLIHCTAGMSADRQKIYNAASTAIADGVDAVLIGSRLFRIRTITRP